MAAKGAKTTTRRRRRKLEGEPGSRGLAPGEVAERAPPPPVVRLSEAVAAEGGQVLCAYRDPLGGHWQLLAALPVERVQPTPFQRDLSQPHVMRLGEVIHKLDRFLDPIIAVRRDDGTYWTPNGHHRLAAMRHLGARTVLALLLPEPEVAYQILALNTEKAHNLREKSLEAIRMARSLAELDPRPEKEFALEFEEAAYLTLGLCYEQRGRFSGGTYHPVLRRVDRFLGVALPRALATREARARRVLELDEVVGRAVEALRAQGFESPYLRAFVVARINPLRGARKAAAEFDETIEAMLRRAKSFRPERVRPQDLARVGGPPQME